MTVGLTTEGFVVETFESLRLQIQARLRAEFGPIPLDESTIEGQIIDIFVEALIKLWEISEVNYDALDVDKAIGAALDALCLLTGTFRRPATFTNGNVILTGDPTTAVPTGERVSTGAGGTVVETLEDVVIVAAAVSWTDVTAYDEGDIIESAGSIYIASDDVPDTIDQPVHTTREGAILPGTPPDYWTWIGEGTGYIESRARAQLTGARAIAAFAIDTVDDPLTGLLGASNLEDLSIGAEQMTDEDLRVLREQQISAPGTSTKDAIGAALRILENVIQVTTFVNNTDSTNGDGMPPHSFEALVRGGEDQDIFDTLLANVAAGIATHGNTSGFATDSEGTEHAMKFSRPVEVEITVSIDVIVDDTFPTDGATLIKDAIVQMGIEQDAGKNAVPSQIEHVAFDLDIGVLEAVAWINDDAIATSAAWIALHAYTAGDVVDNVGRRYVCITNGTSAASGGPVTTSSDITDGTAHWKYLGNTIAIAPRELAIYDVARIAVNITTGTP